MDYSYTSNKSNLQKLFFFIVFQFSDTYNIFTSHMFSDKYKQGISSWNSIRFGAGRLSSIPTRKSQKKFLSSSFYLHCKFEYLNTRTNMHMRYSHAMMILHRGATFTHCKACARPNIVVLRAYEWKTLKTANIFILAWGL